MMKKILCFGDSNTWGCSPVDSSRFDDKTRWPMVMGSILGADYLIIEDGLNGRTVLNLSPVSITANGIEWIQSEIGNYLPLETAIISLGINDVFIGEDVTLQQISDGLENIIDIIRDSHTSGGYTTPEIIIMSPPEYNTEIEGAQFFELQINKLKGLPETYMKLSLKKNCHFFNAADYVRGSVIDGSHLDSQSHILLGRKAAEFISDRIK
jgi:lysophospholipase L1-like esterase